MLGSDQGGHKEAPDSPTDFSIRESEAPWGWQGKTDSPIHFPSSPSVLRWDEVRRGEVGGGAGVQITTAACADLVLLFLCREPTKHKGKIYSKWGIELCFCDFLA